MKKTVKLDIDKEYFCTERCKHSLEGGECNCKLLIETPKLFIIINRNFMLKEDGNVQSLHDE